MIAFLLFVLGIAVGSFLNVLVDRYNSKESAFKGRSRCDHCKHTLAWYDLIPLFSYISLGGKCRYCGRKLSVYYPITELTTGVTFALVALNFQFSIFNFQSIFNFSLILLLISSLIVIFFTDLKYGLIPFNAVVFGTLTHLTFLILNSNFPALSGAEGLILNSALSGLGAFLFLFAIFALTRGRGMGFGDVVYAFLMGLILGFPKIIVGFYGAFVTGAIVSVVLIAAKKKKLKGDTIPFGPFLVLGTIIAMFAGVAIIDLALSYLH